MKWRKSVVCGRLVKKNRWEFVSLGKLEFVSFCRNMLKLRQEISLINRRDLSLVSMTAQFFIHSVSVMD